MARGRESSHGVPSGCSILYTEPTGVAIVSNNAAKHILSQMGRMACVYEFLCFFVAFIKKTVSFLQQTTLVKLGSILASGSFKHWERPSEQPEKMCRYQKYAPDLVGWMHA